MKIAVDFDGTIVEHKFPSIGKERPFACETLRQLSADGHKLILWTVRSGNLLEEALDWCSQRGLNFYSVNSNYPPGSLFDGSRDLSPKIEADVYIDDRNLGGLPDWGEIYTMICAKSQAKRNKSGHRHAPRWVRKLFSNG